LKSHQQRSAVNPRKNDPLQFTCFLFEVQAREGSTQAIYFAPTSNWVAAALSDNDFGASAVDFRC
jgi:hypothetical protein